MKNLLLVEDEVDIREVFMLELIDLNLNIIEASNAIEALEIISNQKIDIVITDLSMSGGNGEILIEHIYEKMPQTPCFITSGYLNQPEKFRELGDNFKLFFKPIDFEQLVINIKEYLD